MKHTELKTTDVKDFEVFANDFDVRKDLHIFVSYVQSRLVKRTARGNHLPKADAKRLAKLMSDPDAAHEVEKGGKASWVSYVDRLALKLGFVDYDTKGSYRGYSSVEPSYPDNYIDYDDKEYKKFVALSLHDQESIMLKTLVDEYSYDNNEFLRTGVMGRLDKFGYQGCATRVLPFVKFNIARNLLLSVLKTCKSGVWYSVASLIQFRNLGI